MPLYTFYLRNARGVSPALESHELSTDGDAFHHASILLDRYASAERVEIWAEDRPVVARHREQPVIRPVQAMEA